MSITVKPSVWSGAVIFLAASSLVFAASDLRLVEATKHGERETARSLVKQHVDVNTADGDGTTALAWAAHRDDLETAALLIGAGANVNVANDYGVTALSLACVNGNAAMVQKLLEAGANPNAARLTGETPLMTASRSGSVDAVKLLLARGADINAKETARGQTALMWAVAENHKEAVQALIEHGADVHARSKSGFTPLLFAAQQGDSDAVRMLLAAGADVNESTPEDGNALVVAVASGHEELALSLLDKGADPNSADRYGITALHYSILKGLSQAAGIVEDSNHPYMYRPNMVNLVKVLLAHGANPNAQITKLPAVLGVNGRGPYFGRVTVVGATPYILAAASYDANLMRTLVAAGADPHAKTQEGTTALIFAAGYAEGLNYVSARTAQRDKDALDAVKLAVELGDDVNAANKHGETPLHGAAFVGSDAIVQFLVDKGANVNVKDDCGQTPLSVARREYPPELTFNSLRPHTIYPSTANLLVKLGAAPLPTSAGNLEDVVNAAPESH